MTSASQGAAARVKTYEIGKRRKPRAGGYVLVWPGGVDESWPVPNWQSVVLGELASNAWVVVAGEEEDPATERLAKDLCCTVMADPVPCNVHQAVLRSTLVLTSDPMVLDLAVKMQRASLAILGPKGKPDPTLKPMHRTVWGLSSITDVLSIDAEREIGALRRTLRGYGTHDYFGTGIPVREDCLVTASDEGVPYTVEE